MKRILTAILVAAMMLSSVFCLSACALLSGGTKHIEDSNGESKELAVITDSDIQEGAYGSLFFMSSHESKGHNTSGVRGKYEDEDNDYSRLSAKKFSGIKTANVCKGTGADVTFTVEATVTNGNFKIVIMDEDNQILHVVPIDEKTTVTVSTEADKLYFVKYVGESAEINVELWRSMA